MQRVDLTVVGGGPVGLFGAFYAGMRGMSVRIVDSLGELGGQLVALYPEKYVYDMPGFPRVLAKDLAREMIEQALQFEPEVVLGETAQDLQRDDEGYTIHLASGAALPTRTVLISAGAGAFTPTKLGVEGEQAFEGRGLSYGIRRLNDYEGKRVMVVGGGDSAFDWAEALEPVAAEVSLVHRRDVFRAHEETVRRVLASTVRVLMWKVVAGLEGEESLSEVVLEDVKTKQRESLPIDALVVNVGYKSSLGPIKGWGLQIERNSICVDRLFQTNLRGVYAVGDVCEYEGKLKLIATGAGEAATAVCLAKTLIDPAARLFPGHSSDMDFPAAHQAG